MAQTTWSKDAPAQEGHYWLRKSGPLGVEFTGIVQVIESDQMDEDGQPTHALEYFYTTGSEWWDGLAADGNLEWAGPIEQPAEQVAPVGALIEALASK
jgi:hypothetical protein